MTQAYTEIGAVLADHGFRHVHGSFYVTDDENMANLFLAIQVPLAKMWCPKCEILTPRKGKPKAVHLHESPGPPKKYGADINTLIELLESGQL